MYSHRTLLCISSAKCCPFLSCIGLWGSMTHSPGLTQSKFGNHAPISSSLLDIFMCTSTQLPPVLVYIAIPATLVTQSICWQLPCSSLVCVSTQSKSGLIHTRKKVFSIRKYLKKTFWRAEGFHYYKSILICVQKFSFQIHGPPGSA